MAMDWQLVGSIVVPSAALVVGWATSRAGTMGAQTNELKRLSERLAVVEKALDTERSERRDQNRAHGVWDRGMVRTLREKFPDEEFPDPPPLDT